MSSQTTTCISSKINQHNDLDKTQNPNNYNHTTPTAQSTLHGKGQIKYAHFKHRHFSWPSRNEFNPLLTIRNKFLV